MKKIKRLGLLLLVFLLSFQSTIYASLEDQFIANHQIVGENEELVRVLVELDPKADRQSVLNKIMQLQDTEFRRSFTASFNGFSLTIPSKFVGRLAQIPGVKRVTRAKSYERATAKSKQLTQALKASKNYGNEGEGMVISIIDSGVDSHHKDMSTLKNPQNAKLPVFKESSDFNIKVPYGFNFADNSYNFKDLPGKSEHGIHVAGIAAASGTYDENNPSSSVEGVAPQAQILAMKVFTNNPNIGSAYDDDIIAAIEKSVELKADVINMSLGSANGFVDKDDPVQKAINYAEEKGILVVVAAGNDATAVTEDDGNPVMKNSLGRTMNDIGLVGGPATSDGALSVASYENSALIQNVATLYDQDKELKKFPFTPDQGDVDGNKYPLVYVEYGRDEDYKDKEVANKVVLVQRGEITFVKKVNNAYDRGAKAVIVFNNQTGNLNMDLTGASKILTTLIPKDKGEELVNLLKSNPNINIMLSPEKSYFENPEHNNMSSFTSWGTTNTLDFKPEISSVGGNIYSTVNDDKYEYKSGTSMATPHVSGAAAIVLSQLKKDLSGINNYAKFVKQTLINTTSVIMSPEGIAYIPRRQGAGLIQVDDAIKNRVLVTYESKDGESVGELRDFRGVKTFDAVLTNYSDESFTFDVNPGKVQTTTTKDSGTVNAQGYPIYIITENDSTATIQASASKITLGPRESKSLKFTLDASSVSDQFVEGFIKFVSTNSNQPSLTFAYMGYAGNWDGESIFEDIDSQEAQKGSDIFYGNTRLLTQLGEVVVPAGISMNSPGGTKYSYENTAISPNGDTAADLIMPQFPMFRNVYKLEFSILDKEGNVVRVLFNESNRKKTFVKQYLANIKAKEQFIVPAYLGAMWNGSIYNPKTGEFVPAEDGVYTYQVKAYLRDSAQPQFLNFKVSVDTVKPEVTIDSVTQEAGGVRINFSVQDASALTYYYARLDVDGEQYSAEKLSDTSYSVLVPNTAIRDSLVELVVKDSAYNESIVSVDAAKTARFISGSQTKVAEAKDQSTNLSLELVDKNIKKVRVTYKNLLDLDLETVGEGEVTAGHVSIDTLLPKEGKYTTYVEELDEKGTVVAKQRLDDVIMDYTPPVIENVVADKNGKVTATINDNIFAANDLLVYINGELQEVPVFDNKITIQVANHKPGDILEVAQKNGDQKGLSTKVSLDYAVEPSNDPIIPPPPPLPPSFGSDKKLVLTYESFVVAGSKAIKTDENPTGTVEEVDGKYYYTIKGTTNDTWTDIYVNGQAADINFVQGTFSARVEIQEGINTINISAKDYTSKLVHEGGVKIFFDKTFANIDWNNHLTFETKGDKTYLVVEEGTEEVTLSGIVSDSGFGYILNINGDQVVQNSEIGKKDLYSASFEKTISVSDGDIITVTLSDANQNIKEFKIQVRYKPVYPDLELKKNISKQVHEGVAISDVIENIPENYLVEFVEDVSKLPAGSHKLHVKVTYPDKSEKIFDVNLVLSVSNPVSLSAEGVVVSATEKELDKEAKLRVEIKEEENDSEVIDSFKLSLTSPLRGKVKVKLPINKKQYKGLYLVKEDGERVKLNPQVSGNEAVVEVEALGTFQLVYDKVFVDINKPLNPETPKVEVRVNDTISSGYVGKSSSKEDTETSVKVISLGNDLYELVFSGDSSKVGSVSLVKDPRKLLSAHMVDDKGNIIRDVKFTQKDGEIMIEASESGKYLLKFEASLDKKEDEKSPSDKDNKPVDNKDVSKIEGSESASNKDYKFIIIGTAVLLVLLALLLFLLKKRKKEGK